MLLPHRRALLSSPLWTPAQLPGLVLWLDASRGVFQDAARTTPAVADADPVGGWQDFSGAGNHASQATGSKRPVLKLAIVNSRPVLRFDGVDDALQIATSLDGNTGTWVAVAQKRIAGTGYLTMATSTKYPVLVRSTSTDQWGTYLAGDLLSGQNINSGFSVVALVARAFNDVDLVTNGTVLNKTTGSSPSSAPHSWVGANDTGSAVAGQWAPVDIAELLYCSGALSSADRARTVAYAGLRYGITVA